MEFVGKVIAVLPVREGTSNSGRAWKVQEYVVEDHGQYPRKMAFEVFGEDKINQFNIQMNEELKVSFDIDARQWRDRWFNSIRAWKVERVSADQAAAAATAAPAPASSGRPARGQAAPQAPAAAPDFAGGNETDDLPF